MSSSEIIDILDDNGQVVGSINRDEAERANHTTQNVLIFIFNSSGQVWVQLRPKTKNHYPGMWDISACGGIVSGEEPDVAAERETEEETGLKPDLYHVESFMNVFPGDNGEQRRRLSHLYIGISDDKPKVNEEVDEFKLWEVDDLITDIKTNPEKYVPSFMFELQKAANGRGVIEAGASSF